MPIDKWKGAIYNSNSLSRAKDLLQYAHNIITNGVENSPNHQNTLAAITNFLNEMPVN